MVREFSCIGYGEYDQYFDEIRRIVYDADNDKNENFLLGINEAVCNAALYSVDGLKNAPINLKIRIERRLAINAVISGNTKPFNARAYKDRLDALALDPKISQMDWADYTRSNVSGRGIWLMLTGSDQVFFSETGQTVSLHLILPRPSQVWTNRLIFQLAPRLVIVKDVCAL